MARRVFITLSILATLSGFTLLLRDHSLAQACSFNASPLTGAGLSSACSADLVYYFFGFVLSVIGPMILGISAWAMVRRRAQLDTRRAARVERDRAHAMHDGLYYLGERDQSAEAKRDVA